MSWEPTHNQTVYKDSLETIVDGLGGTGILTGMAVTYSSSGPVVAIASGTYKIGGTEYSYSSGNSGSVLSDIKAALTSGYYAYVVLAVDSSGTISALSGYVESASIADAYVNYTSDSTKCKLATILIAQNDATLDPADIKDWSRMVVNTGSAITLAGTPDYITISGDTITRNQIDLAADVTGVLPSANLDSDTAHLSGAQTFTGAKSFNYDGDSSTPPLTVESELKFYRLSDSYIFNSATGGNLYLYNDDDDKGVLVYTGTGGFAVHDTQNSGAETFKISNTGTVTTGVWNGSSIGDTYLGGLAKRETMNGSASVNHYGHRLRLGGSSPYTHYGIVLSQFDNGGYTLHAEYDASNNGVGVIGYKSGSSNFGTWDFSDINKKHFIFDQSQTLSHSIRDDTTGSSANVFINSSTGLLERSTSSQRYKTNFRDIPYDRDAFHNVTPRLFESTIPSEVNDEGVGIERWGLIAEDVQTAFGDTIMDINDNNEVENYDTRGIIAVMYQEIKNLKAEIDELRNNNGG